MQSVHRVIALVAAVALPFGHAASQTPHDKTSALLGLPATSTSADPRVLALGRRLFFDERLSADGTVSCATCHRPDRAYTDGRRVGVGAAGRPGTRNVPSLVNVVYSSRFLWDGRRETLESVVLDPLVNPVEHGIPNLTDVFLRLRSDPEYVRLLRKAYGTGVAEIGADQVSKALAAFVGSLVSGDSPFDRYYYGGDKSALTPSAAAGLEVFRGSGQCASCHTIGEKSALFSDQRFHSLGVGSERIQKRMAQVALRVTAGTMDAARQSVLIDADLAELGHFLVTRNPRDIGSFRTPSLRNVALTAPYMHDGSVSTLEEAVERELYWRTLSTNRASNLTNREKADLVEFLKSLTSSKIP